MKSKIKFPKPAFINIVKFPKVCKKLLLYCTMNSCSSNEIIYFTRSKNSQLASHQTIDEKPSTSSLMNKIQESVLWHNTNRKYLTLNEAEDYIEQLKALKSYNSSNQSEVDKLIYSLNEIHKKIVKFKESLLLFDMETCNIEEDYEMFNNPTSACANVLFTPSQKKPDDDFPLELLSGKNFVSVDELVATNGSPEENLQNTSSVFKRPCIVTGLLPQRKKLKNGKHLELSASFLDDLEPDVLCPDAFTIDLAVDVCKSVETSTLAVLPVVEDKNCVDAPKEKFNDAELDPSLFTFNRHQTIEELREQWEVCARNRKNVVEGIIKQFQNLVEERKNADYNNMKSDSSAESKNKATNVNKELTEDLQKQLIQTLNTKYLTPSRSFVHMDYFD